MLAVPPGSAVTPSVIGESLRRSPSWPGFAAKWADWQPPIPTAWWILHTDSCVMPITQGTVSDHDHSGRYTTYNPVRKRKAAWESPGDCGDRLAGTAIPAVTT